MKAVTIADLKRALAQYPDSTPILGETKGSLSAVLSVQGNKNEDGTLNNVGLFWWPDKYQDHQILGKVDPMGPEITLNVPSY